MNNDVSQLAIVIEAFQKGSSEKRARMLAVAKGDPPGKRTLVTSRRACQEFDPPICTLTLRRYENRGLIRGIRTSKRRVRYDLEEIRRLATEGVVAA